MPTSTNEPDILGRLRRLLAVTPEHAFAAPPLSRRTLAAAVEEIARLRARVAELEAQQSADPQN